MENGIVIFNNGHVLTTILVHDQEFKSLSEILDIYAKEFGFNRNSLSGVRTNVIDITDVNRGSAKIAGYAKNEWPGERCIGYSNG